jgi:hypothetical protein
MRPPGTCGGAEAVGSEQKSSPDGQAPGWQDPLVPMVGLGAVPSSTEGVPGTSPPGETINTYRLAGRANIAHARRDLHDRADVFAVYGI